MDKTESLKEWLVNMKDYHLKVNRVMHDVFNQLLSYLGKNGFESLKGFNNERMKTFAGSDRKVAQLAYQAHYLASQKIWSIEKKYGGK
jgi:hypothetical protein